MTTPGIADPYWYEWYVGLDQIIKMLNPDNEIEYVSFQHETYDTIDDVVVGYKGAKQEICYQVKHEIATSKPTSLSFGQLLEASPTTGKSLLSAMVSGWNDAQTLGNSNITPVLFTNRSMGRNRTTREFKEEKYSAYPLKKFFELIKLELETCDDIFNPKFTDPCLQTQWREVLDKIGLDNQETILDFVDKFELASLQPDLEEFEKELVEALEKAFSCAKPHAQQLFTKLLAELRIWTTTSRKKTKITVEDVYTTLGDYAIEDPSQHNLLAPRPFFPSRHTFCEQLVTNLRTTNKKVVFISGEPGSGKTSIASYLYSQFDLFLLRYHTFKPISPNQTFYNSDQGISSEKDFFGTLLVQLREKFRGRLAANNVPLSNSFCSIESMRGHALRLLGILGQEASKNNKKLFICIDGIDHAARSKNDPSFLETLYTPSEVPEGVCVVIVGQPLEMYRAQYPLWLDDAEQVENICVPILDVEDIKMLLNNRVPHAINKLDIISQRLLEKTKGNNLSVVFAVEELSKTDSFESILLTIENSHVSDNIQQYYNYIWNFVKEELKRINLQGLPPESNVACPLVLMDGVVSTHVLSNANFCGLKEDDWEIVFEKLYPLIIPSENKEEYSLFHNDFRVFLMSQIKEYNAKYKSIALSLAQYILSNNEGSLSYMRGIPLLIHADRQDLVPEFFTDTFVIKALAEHTPESRLEEYAQYSYDAVLKLKKENFFISTYLAIKTLSQHQEYYEYYGRSQNIFDYAKLNKIDLVELQVIPLSLESIPKYSKVLELCEALNTSDSPEHKERGINLYAQWFGKLSPLDLLPFYHEPLKKQFGEIEKQDAAVSFLKEWGAVAAKIKQPIPFSMTDKQLAQNELIVVLSFGDAFFNKAFDEGDYSQALQALQTGLVSIDNYAKKLEDLLFSDGRALLSFKLGKIISHFQNIPTELLANAILALNEQEVVFSPTKFVFSPPILNSHFYESEETSFVIVLYSFLIGYTRYLDDDSIIFSDANNALSSINDTDSQSLEVLHKMARLACLLGKSQKNPKFILTRIIKEDIEWFLTQKIYRYFDHPKACKFLLYMVLKCKITTILMREVNLISLLKDTLIHQDYVDLEFKMHILEFFKLYGDYESIKGYLLYMYGEDGNLIYKKANYTQIHSLLLPYGILVLPQLMQQVSHHIKWDVVSYTGHKEYIMQAPCEQFEALSKIVPSTWRDYGKRLYLLSNRASIANNRYATDIQESLLNAAIVDGLASFWELRFWDEELYLDSNLLHYSVQKLIKNASNENELLAAWFLHYGISSWYSKDDRDNATLIYKTYLEKANELGVDKEILKKLTPEWVVIAQHEDKKNEQDVRDISYEEKKKQEKKNAYDSFEGSNVTLLLDNLQLRDPSLINERLKHIINWLNDKDQLTTTVAKEILESMVNFLSSNYFYWNTLEREIKLLISKLGSDAFWKFAKVLGINLTIHGFQFSTQSMYYLLDLWHCKDAEQIKELLSLELESQEKWVTGNHHINIRKDWNPVKNQFPTPTSHVEMVFYVLMEQIEIKSAKLTEAALRGVYALGARFETVAITISTSWKDLTIFQQSMLLIVIARWGHERSQILEVLIDFLEDEYEKSNNLELKYYLHSILKAYDQSKFENIEFTASSVEYQLPMPKNFFPVYNSNHFLDLTAMCYNSSEMNDDIHEKFVTIPAQQEFGSSFIKPGDWQLYASKIKENQILYGEEQKGRWRKIPTALKKAWLLLADDPFLVTEMPRVQYNEELEHIFKNDKVKFLSNIESFIKQINDDIHDYELVVGSCFYCSFEKNDISFYEVAKLNEGLLVAIDNSFASCLGNYGLLFKEGGVFEGGRENIQETGLSLFNIVDGKMLFPHGNAQIVPSKIWKEVFHITQSEQSPFFWHDENDECVMRFERIVFPKENGFLDKFYTQPMLFRWLCKKEWLTTQLDIKNLRLRFVRREETTQ